MKGVIATAVMLGFALLSFVDHSAANFLSSGYAIFAIILFSLAILALAVIMLCLVAFSDSIELSKVEKTNEKLAKDTPRIVIDSLIMLFFWYAIYVNISTTLSTVGITLTIITFLMAFLSIKIGQDLQKELENG